MTYSEMLGAVNSHLKHGGYHCSSIMFDDRGLMHLHYALICGDKNKREMLIENFSHTINFLKNQIHFTELDSFIGNSLEDFTFQRYTFAFNADDNSSMRIEMKMDLMMIENTFINSSIHFIFSYCNSKKVLNEITKYF